MMPNGENHYEDEFRPRLIIWDLGGDGTKNGTVPLSTAECILILDSIAKLSKPIIVFSGVGLLARTDLYDIVVYGNALGLKMIVEADAQHLSEDVLRRFRSLGPRIFRVMIDGAVVEDMDTRFKESPLYDSLLLGIERLRRAGYEIHLGTKVQQPDVRALSFALDFAVRRGVKGLYCQLDFSALPLPHRGENTEQTDSDEYIETIANLKRFLPKNMYFSPQCIRYGMQTSPDTGEDVNEEGEHDLTSQWTHWCLAGKTFVFIAHDAKLQVCAGLPIDCADLRSNGYDFVSPWKDSQILRQLRDKTLTCSQTQALFKRNGKERTQHSNHEKTQEIQDREQQQTG